MPREERRRRPAPVLAPPDERVDRQSGLAVPMPPGRSGERHRRPRPSHDRSRGRSCSTPGQQALAQLGPSRSARPRSGPRDRHRAETASKSARARARGASSAKGSARPVERVASPRGGAVARPRSTSVPRGPPSRKPRRRARQPASRADPRRRALRHRGGLAGVPVAPLTRSPRRWLALVEVDDQRDAVAGRSARAAVLDEVGVVARDPVARVDLDREARRARPDLRHVEQLEPVPLAWPAAGGPATTSARKRLSSGVGIRVAAAVAERDRLGQHAVHVAAGLRAGGQRRLGAGAACAATLARSWSRSSSVHRGAGPTC